jgi:hypothetical protein
VLRSRVEGVAERCAAGVEVEHGGLRTLLKAGWRSSRGSDSGEREHANNRVSKQQACFAMRTIRAGADGGWSSAGGSGGGEVGDGDT